MNLIETILLESDYRGAVRDMIVNNPRLFQQGWNWSKEFSREGCMILIDNILSEARAVAPNSGMTDDLINDALLGTKFTYRTQSLNAYAKLGITPRVKDWMDRCVEEDNRLDHDDLLACCLMADNAWRNGSYFGTVNYHFKTHYYPVLRNLYGERDSYTDEQKKRAAKMKLQYLFQDSVSEILIHTTLPKFFKARKLWKDAIKRLDDYRNRLPDMDPATKENTQFVSRVEAYLIREAYWECLRRFKYIVVQRLFPVISGKYKVTVNTDNVILIGDYTTAYSKATVTIDEAGINVNIIKSGEFRPEVTTIVRWPEHFSRSFRNEFLVSKIKSWSGEFLDMIDSGAVVTNYRDITDKSGLRSSSLDSTKLLSELFDPIIKEKVKSDPNIASELNKIALNFDPEYVLSKVSWFLGKNK